MLPCLQLQHLQEDPCTLVRIVKHKETKKAASRWPCLGRSRCCVASTTWEKSLMDDAQDDTNSPAICGWAVMAQALKPLLQVDIGMGPNLVKVPANERDVHEAICLTVLRPTGRFVRTLSDGADVKL